MNQRRKDLSAAAILCLVGIISACAVIVTCVIYAQEGDGHSRDGGQRVLECGPDITAARRAGCVLDISGFHWTPKACFYEDLSTEAMLSYNIAGEKGTDDSIQRQFDWYEDSNMTRRLETPSDINTYLERQAEKSGKVVAITHLSWHTTHCMYISRIGTLAMAKVARGEKNIYVPDMSIRPHHMEHCESMVHNALWSAQHSGLTKQIYEAEFSFTRCVKLA